MVEGAGIIARVEEDSIAAEIGLEPGDRILRINQHPLQDLIDYRYHIAGEYLEVEVVKADGEEWVLEIEKEYDEDLGLSFENATFDRIRPCQNRCLFCFVDQMAPHLRPTLYEKDDDYRLSFLQGNFVTLTNLKNEDWERILSLHLSPLYVSVHCTDPERRREMLGHSQAGRILEQLQKLTAAGIEIHAQVVLCPGVNDGAYLDQTVKDLGDLGPQILSIAIVPVGLTRFRQGLKDLRPFTLEEARGVLEQIHRWQKDFRSQRGFSFVYGADEFYIMAGVPLPTEKQYDDFPQLENGVGLSRLFINEFEQAWSELDKDLEVSRQVTIATGVSAGKVLKNLILRCREIPGLKVDLVTVPNRFFGETVTVAGLLTGSDFMEALKGRDLGEEVLVPACTLKAGEPLFLDGLTLQEVSDQIGVPFKGVEVDGRAFLHGVMGIKD